MNRFFALHRVAAALIACGILRLALPASADEELPFKGWADEVVTGFEFVPDGIQLTADGAGEASYLAQLEGFEGLRDDLGSVRVRKFRRHTEGPSRN